MNELTSLADNFGNTISFSWITSSAGPPLAISSVSIASSATPTTPQNYSAQYTYASAGGTAPGTIQPEALTGVAYLDNNGTVQDSTTYQYGNSALPMAITAILDNAGVQRWGVTYDSTGRATVSSVTGAASGPLSYQVAYTAIPSAGGTFTRTVTNSLGKQSIYNYLNSATQGLQLTSIANQASSLSPASTKTYTYGSDAFVASITDEDGNLETLTHDPRGMPNQTVEASGTSSVRTTTITWDSVWRQPDTTTTAVSMTSMAYNSAGALTSKTVTDETTFTVPYSTNGRTRTWTYAWTSGGEISAIHGPLWVSGGTIDTTSFTYSANGYLQTLANALGQTTTVTAWDWRGAPTSVTDPNGVVTTLTYDIHGRLLTSTINPGASQSEYQFAYDAVGDLTQVTLPMGATLQYQYDNAQRMVMVTNVRGETRIYTYDNATDPLSLNTKTSGGTTTQIHTGAYDDWGRLLQSIGAASQTWNLAYDNLSNLLSVTDPPIGSSSGNERQNAYDPLNRVATQTDPQGATLGYAYDVADNLTAFTDALSSTTNRTVDGFGEIIQEVSPARGTITSWYDGGGNLTKTVDADSIETDFTYDAANRRTAMSSPGAISAAYAYDATSGGNFGIGRLTSASVASDSVAYVYDAQGRVMSDSKVIADSGYGTAFNVTYAYDANGKVIAITYPSGDVVNIARATDGQITGVTETLAGGSSQTVASGVTFEPYGPLSGLTYGNGLVLTRAYNEDYNLTGITTAPSSGSALLNVSFSWRPDWRIAGVTDSAGTGRGASFGYTNAGRVSTASGPWGSQSFAYDANGNWTSATATGPPSAGTATFAYDGFKRLKTVTEGSTTLGYAYDYLGRNDWSSTAAGPVAFIYDTDGHLIAEHNASSGAMQREYIWIGDQMAGIVDNSSGTPTLDAVTTGQIEEPLLVTAADQSLLFDGYVDPYGNQGTLATTSYTMNMRLPGQYFQAGSGLSQNGWRDYDPTIGRYIEGDPIGIDGGQNVYAYVDGDPLNRRDPLGLFDPTPLTIAERAALGEEVVGGGPEDPFADAAALATLGAGLLISELTPDPTPKAQPGCHDGGPGDPCKGLRDQLAAHQKKLSDYIRNPAGSDNKGLLGQGRDEAVISGRIASLQAQIRNFQKLLDECERQHGTR